MRTLICCFTLLFAVSPACGDSATKPAANVLPAKPGVYSAPLMTLQFSVKQHVGPSLEVAAVVRATKDGMLSFHFLTCPPQEPGCSEATESVEGKLTAKDSRYTLTADTARWTIALTGTGKRMTAFTNRCDYPGHGGVMNIISSDFDRITWTGTVDGKPVLRPGACNFYLRAGQATITAKEPG